MSPIRAPTVTLAALLLTGLVLVSARPVASVPPLGSFLDPVRGIWAVARTARLRARERLELPGLTAPVDVLIDDRGVPHIYAEDEEDLYRVMGYVVARDRLFQLEVQSRAGEGTLTGLVGPAALDADRQARHLGLAWSAERKLAALDRATVGYRAVAAYAAGVNAYLDGLGTRGLPLEYRLLGRRPRRWEPVHTAYLFARMGFTLASVDPADSRELVSALVGAVAADGIVPLNNPIQEPIQPHGGNSPRYAFRRLPPPRDPGRRSALAFDPATPRGDDGDAVGSNNWAVSPGRTRDGYALLAGDPHLELTLPSLWYEVHLSVPGRFDVAGVSLVGSPGVVIGFNRDLAWSFTNTGSDVLDRYLETVDDSLSPARYRLDGAWEPLTLRIEAYRGPRGDTLAVDTVRYTHRGPMVRRGAWWLSLRWTVHDPSSEVELFLRAAATRTADEWLRLMRDYVAPTQNGLVADRSGNIAIRSSGRYPLRPGSGRGDRVFDGSRRANDWTGWLPVDRYPFAMNPSQGYLASANQQPVDPLDNPAYLGADWYAPWRALRINALLRADSAVTADAMRRYQTDPGSARADALVPYLLGAADAVLAAGEDDAILGRAADLLREWNRTYTPDDRRAVLFELMLAEVDRRTWDELTAGDSDRPRYVPPGSTLLELLQDPDNPWWDDRRTPEVERRDDILAASLRAALESALEQHGDPAEDGWRWDRYRTANIQHLLRIPALSALGLSASGGPSTLSPLSGRGTHGASWRMVVELGDETRAWATYPGGQSGNPASPRYDDRIPQWTRGELDRVLFPARPEDLPAERVLSRLSFRPGR